MSQTEFKRRLQALMNKPENQVCSDCPERQPRWASLIVPPGSPTGALPIGAFCCLECSGSHRRLGVHISFVRSINLDSWKEREVQAMEQGGNKKVNEIWEAKLSSFGLHSGKPQAGADGRTRERYIRDKYERRKFFDPDAMQNFYSGKGAESSSEEESSEEESEQTTPPKRAGSGKIPTIRAPSDAAKKRAESRKARLDAYRSSSSNPSTKTSINAVKTKPPPQQKSEVVDLLDFASPIPDPRPPPDPPSHPVSPALDLFSEMTISSITNPAQPTVSGFAPSMDNFTTNPTSTNVNNTTQPKKFDTNEILSMFNAPNPTATTSSYSNSAATNPISNMFPTQAPMMMQQRPQGTATSMMMMQSPGVNMFMVQQQNQIMPQQHNMMMMQRNPYMQGYAAANANNVMNAAMSYTNNNVNLSIGVTTSPAINGISPSSSSIMGQQAPMGGFARQNQPGLNIMGSGSGSGSTAKTDINGFPLYEL